MTTHLLDANVLIALTVAEHEHHEPATAWLAGVDRWAMCPITEGALVRFLLRLGETGATAAAVLAGLREHPASEFWPDSVSYSELDLRSLTGHRQVTDTYLVGLAAGRTARLATFDTALMRQFPDVCVTPHP